MMNPTFLFSLLLVHFIPLQQRGAVAAFAPRFVTPAFKIQRTTAVPPASFERQIGRTPPSPSRCCSPNDGRATGTHLFATPTERSPVVVNLGLVRQTVFNQVLLGWTIWTGGLGAQVLARDARFTAVSFVLGVAGLLALISFSRSIETSESPAVADLNLSTNLLVLRFFGDKPQPVTAFAVSALIAGLTGLVEETNFRGALIPGLLQWSGGNLPVAVALSTVIFAVLHVNPLGLFKGKEAAQDAAVLVGYQIVTGSIFAALYLVSGNLAVPIIAHSLFDLYVFFSTHLIVTQQMQYAENQASMPVAPRSVEAKWRSKRGDEFLTSCRETFYLADSNRDGVLSREELRIALYSYGIRLSRDDSEIVVSAADTDRSGAIDFGEFLEFVGPAGSPGKAIKGSLLGACERG